jgi:hypothetical protein
MINGASVPRIHVESSSVASVGYAAEVRALEIEFRSGAVYRYFDVPAEIYGALLVAESKGAYFNRAVKGRFGYARL